MITKDYNNTINKIENNIKVYDDFNKARREFYRLNNLYYDDECYELLNKINYEIDFLSFYIEQGKLFNILQQDNNLNFFIKKLDSNCISYLKERFQNSNNDLLKSLYSLILGHIKSKNKLKYLYSFVDLTMSVYYENVSQKNDCYDFLSICLINAYVNAVSKNHPKKDEIIIEISNFIHDDRIPDIFSKVYLIEFLFSKNDYENFDINDMDTLCWKFAKSCIQESDSINILKLGKKINNKLPIERYDWDSEIGNYYEKLMLKEKSFIVKQRFCKKAIKHYKKSNPEKIIELTKYLEEIQNEYETHPFQLLEIEPSFLIHVDLILIKLINFNSQELINYLITSEENMPNLDYGDFTLYTNLKKSSPILMNSSIEIFDSNKNNRLSNDYFNNESKKAEVCYNFIHTRFAQKYMRIYLNSIFEFTYVNNLFNYTHFINYLNESTPLDEETIKFLNPAISSYFKEIDLYLARGNGNFVLFMDSIISKMEFIIRKICNKNEIITTNIYSNNISEKITLEKIFKLDEFKKILSNSDYHFLKIVLTDEGINLRNELSHGLNFNKYSFSNANLLLFSFLRLLKYL